MSEMLKNNRLMSEMLKNNKRHRRYKRLFLQTILEYMDIFGHSVIIGATSIHFSRCTRKENPLYYFTLT